MLLLQALLTRDFDWTVEWTDNWLQLLSIDPSRLGVHRDACSGDFQRVT